VNLRASAQQFTRPLYELGECIQLIQHSLSIEQEGTDIRTVNELLGRSVVSTTMVYTHVLKEAAGCPTSPLEAFAHG
jgi:hypothetical protein